MIEFINQTLINAWSMCGERVRRRWIEGDIIPPGIAARIGTGVHSGADVNYSAKIKTGEDEPLDVVLDAARDGYVKSVSDNGVFFPPEEKPSAQKQLEDGIDTVVELTRLYREECAPQVLPILVEEEIFLNDPDLDIPFRGTLDVLADDRALRDIKTSARKWPQSKADTSVQPTLYNELVKEKTGSYPERIVYDIFTKTKKPAYQVMETTRQPGDFETLKLRVKLMMQSITAGIFPPAEPGHWCCSPKWCGYYYSCPHIPAHKKILPKRSE
ncbi:MAG: hypothetical protein DRP56_02790 [Planctomycetota bacterium]|nr:MAG: hypothetical protein DRP56_02790 [Planctomycetota bacterium]